MLTDAGISSLVPKNIGKLSVSIYVIVFGKLISVNDLKSLLNEPTTSVMPSSKNKVVHLVYKLFGIFMFSKLSDKLSVSFPVPDMVKVFVLGSKLAVTSS